MYYRICFFFIILLFLLLLCIFISRSSRQKRKFLKRYKRGRFSFNNSSPLGRSEGLNWSHGSNFKFLLSIKSLFSLLSRLPLYPIYIFWSFSLVCICWVHLTIIYIFFISHLKIKKKEKIQNMWMKTKKIVMCLIFIKREKISRIFLQPSLFIKLWWGS